MKMQVRSSYFYTWTMRLSPITVTYHNQSQKQLTAIVFLLLSLSGNVCYQFVNISSINNWADVFLEQVVKKLQSKDLEYVTAPDLWEEDTELVGKIRVELGIHATEGVFGELTSLKRAADVRTLSTANLIIDLPLMFSKMGIHFDECKTWCGSAKDTDELEIKLPIYENISIIARLATHTEEGRCVTVLDYIKIGEFKHLEIIFSEFCLSSVHERVSDWIVKYFNTRFLTSVQTTLENILSQQLKETNCVQL